MDVCYVRRLNLGLVVFVHAPRVPERFGREIRETISE